VKLERHLPLLGVILAIAITTAMDVTGLSAFSAFALFPLLVIFWIWQRVSRQEIGFTIGHARHYAFAILHPVMVIGVIAAIAFAMGATDLSHLVWRKVAINLTSLVIGTFLVAMVTEEGFFRGWLWASLHRAGSNETRTLVWTSIAFAAWHISAVVLPTGFNPPREQVPVFLVNAAVIGLIWGMLRLLSGSIVISSLCHALWNGLDYVFFGFGTHQAALGIAKTGIYGPENGLLGLAANVLFASLLWRMAARKHIVLRPSPPLVEAATRS
jgi:hypothetical protein